MQNTARRSKIIMLWLGQYIRPWRSWISQWIPIPKAGGSNPSGRAIWKHHWNLNPYGLDSMVFCFIIPVFKRLFKIVFSFSHLDSKKEKYKFSNQRNKNRCLWTHPSIFYCPIYPLVLGHIPLSYILSSVSWTFASNLNSVQKGFSIKKRVISRCIFRIERWALNDCWMCFFRNTMTVWIKNYHDGFFRKTAVYRLQKTKRRLPSTQDRWSMCTAALLWK